MSMHKCLILHAKALKDFDKQAVTDAAKVYESRGNAEDDANIAAIEDHLRELEAEKERITGDILAAWKKADPKGYAKAESGSAKPKRAKADPLAEIREFFKPGNIILSDYWNTHDKVLEFREGERGAGSWDVKVVAVKKDGDQWVETDSPRWHATAPGKSKVVDAVSAEKSNQVASKQSGDQAASTAEMDALKAEMGEAIGELAALLGAKNNLTQEEETRIIPIVSKIFRVAAKMGYVKFKDAARYVMKQIRALAGDAIANRVTIDNLQAGYINIAREIGGDKREAMAYDSLDEIMSGDDLPDGWTETTPGGMAVSTDPVSGGIIDKVAMSDEWFVIPQNDAIKKIGGLGSRAEAFAALQDAVNAEQRNGPEQRGNTNLERDSQDAEATDGVGAQGVRAGRRGDGQAGERGIQQPEAESGAGRGSSLFGPEAPASGEPGDQSIYTGAGRSVAEASSSGSGVDSGSDSDSIDGPPIEPDATDLFAELAESRVSLDEAKAEQSAADRLEHKPGLANIRETLPILTEGQQEDVHITETRFAVPDGYGMLFTNGTGTGKTFTGLGVIKRFAVAGKSNIIIAVPNDKIADDWRKSGALLNLDISLLKDTKDAGRGIVITTYANFGQNPALASRKWDLVIADEAHKLSLNAEGEGTLALGALKALTMHPDGAYTRAKMLHGDLYSRLSELQALAKSQRTSDDERDWYSENGTQAKIKPLLREIEEKEKAIKAEIEANQGEKRPRALFLSATPFAYEKTVDWANGYLFDYNEGRGNENNEYRGYNAGSNHDQFFMQHFGYRMRYNKLTEPDAKVDRGLMQRQFNGWLKKRGALSGRMLDVKADYDRRFILTESAIGTRIDEALEWFEAKRKAGDDRRALGDLRDKIAEKFDYLSRRYLLEAIKAREVIPHVREHLAMGRKVVVFHDYKKGGGFNPFNVEHSKGETAGEYNAVVDEFRAEFKDLIESDWPTDSPIEAFRKEFPGVLLFNGDVPKGQRRGNVEKFQDDASGPQIILVQSDAGKEGISLHDTTGKHQRVLLNLGQPTAPTTAIQQEGRIYRTGQVTDAIFRYLNTGTDWEKWAFATTIAQRASAAENLGMGEQARALKDAFIAGFEESDDYRAGMEDEGKGGKERDRLANAAITEYDRAKAFYFGTQKKTSKNKAQEGVDYFATPEPVGLKMMEFADIRPGESVLEPSAGHGAIARWMPDTTIRTAIEPSTALRSRLAMVFDGKMLDHDFESLNIVNKFDAIVMNPPFGSGGKTAIDHLAKAATHLRDGGRIVALIPRGPAADKRFDKWFYEGVDRPSAKMGETGRVGEYHMGDIVTVDGRVGSWEIIGKSELGVELRPLDGQGSVGHWPSHYFETLKRGARTEQNKASDRLNLVADIVMPSVTFERAGTQVATRIVVLEKSPDSPQVFSPSFTDVEDINDLFDRMEGLTIAPRAKAIEEIQDTDPPKVAKAKKEDARAAAIANEEKAKEAGAVVEDASQATFEMKGNKIVTNAPTIEYTTKGGKLLTGVLVPDKTMAKAADKFSWATREWGMKYFVRIENIERPNVAESTVAAYGPTEIRPIFYSQLARSIEAAPSKLDGAPAAQWKMWLLANAQKLGVKKDEIQWTGITDWLDAQAGNADGFVRDLIKDGATLSPAQRKKIRENPGIASSRISKADIAAFLDNGGVKVQEVEIGGDGNRQQAAYDAVKNYAEENDLYFDFSGRTYTPGYLIRYSEDGSLSESDGAEVAYEGTVEEIADELGLDIDSGATQFETYQLPGGENYRELLLTLPTKIDGELPSGFEVREFAKGRWGVFGPGPLPENRYGSGVNREAALRTFYNQHGKSFGFPVFKSSHFDTPNILAHVRFNERTDADGKRVLFIEELQSDWAQKGRKEGFASDDKLANSEIARLTALANKNLAAGLSIDEHRELADLRRREKPKTGVPSAPFVTDTKAWTSLAMKRMIAYAAENGFDSIAWTTGEQQAARYDLSKQVDHVAHYKDGNGKLRIAVQGTNGAEVWDAYDPTPKEIEETLGKEVAEKILNDEGVDSGAGVKILRGIDLKVGGEGMKGYYDGIVPQVANDVLKKIGGGKVGQVEIDNGMVHSEISDGSVPDVMQQPGFSITDKMRETAAGGLALFSPVAYGATYDLFETRPGTTDKQRDEGRAALDALESAERRILGPASSLRGNQAAVLGSAISRDFHEDGGTSFVGQTVTTTGDLALLGQVVRDPRFETFRVFYTDKAGKIVGQSAYSSRLPGAVYLPDGFAEKVAADKAKFGAAGYWMMHNHPSGRVEASRSDEALTVGVAGSVPGFEGHVILDHNEYGVVDVSNPNRPRSYSVSAPELASKDLRSNPEVPHAMLGESINGPADLALAGKKLQVDPSVAVLVGTDANNRIALIVEVADWALTAQGSTPAQRMRALASIRRASREAGLSRIFAVVPGSLDQYQAATKLSFLTDVVDSSGNSAAALGRMDGTGALPVTKANRTGLKARANEAQWKLTKGSRKGEYFYRDVPIKKVESASATDSGWSHVWTFYFGGRRKADTLGEATKIIDRLIERDAIQPNIESSSAPYKATKPVDVNSPEFKRWFGDSKVVDAEGKPLVVYHGTDADFATFKTRVGVWFSASKDTASRYANIRGRWKAERGDNVIPAFLTILNPAPYDVMDKLMSQTPRDGSQGRVVREQLMRLGYDGVEVDGGDSYIAFEPTQIKSAISNTGAFDPDNPSILESTQAPYGQQRQQSIPAAGAQPAPSPTRQTVAPLSGGAIGNNSAWSGMPESKLDDVIRTLQDKHIDTKRTVQAIRAAGRQVADKWDPYLQETLFHGRAAKRTLEFVETELTPLARDLAMRGLTLDDLDQYLHARHAEEANALIANRNPSMPDGGSGMTNQQARDYFANLDPSKQRRLEASAARVDAIIAKTRQTYVAYGLESQETVDGWADTFAHYVPLMREDKDGAMGIGQGFSIKGKESKSRTGSTRAVVDIMANIAMQRERAIVRGEKNRVSVALLGLAKFNPNPDFWTVDKAPILQRLNPQTGLVESYPDPLYKDRDNVMVAKVPDGNGGVQERAVVFNTQDDRAMNMVRALKNLDAAQLEGFLGFMAPITRYFASINTQYNPVFGIANITRDFQDAMLNLSSTEIAGHKLDVAKHTLGALRGIYIDTRQMRKGQPATSAYAQLWEDFQHQGGQTGYRDMFRTSEDRAKAIERAIDPHKWMDSTLGKIFTAGGALKVPVAVAQDKAGWLFDWLSDYNEALENAVRLSAYKVGLEQGMSKQRAAAMAKGLTVNFNRKGSVALQAGALYAFFNASAQGTGRIAETIFTINGNDAKSIRLSKAGAKIVAGGILFGSLQALMLAAAGFDDDEPPEFVRERNTILPIKALTLGIVDTKKYITIPMPLGFAILPNIGRLATEYVMGGFKGAGKYAVRMIGIAADAFNPIGGNGTILQMLSPTATDPLVAVAENKDWTKKPIAKVSMDKTVPGHKLWKDTASTPAKLAAEIINTLSGGTEYVAGGLSPTPDQIDYLFGQATGGVGRELSKLEQSAFAMYRGEELPAHKIPLVGRFYGNAADQTSQGSTFYTNINRINEYEAQIKGLRKDGKGAEAAKFIAENPEARMVMRANHAERVVQKLRKEKHDLVAKDAPRERVKAVEDRIRVEMLRFNDAVKASKQRQKEAA